ncbi:MAG: phosphopantetheine-binding protein [Desulfovermiculus sp.]
MNNELKAQLKRIIVHELDLKDFQPEDIGDDDILFGDKFGLDSIDAVELVFQVKMHFGVEIRDMKEGRPALLSVNTLSHFIHNRLEQ